MKFSQTRQKDPTLARVAPTVEQNMMKGLDIREWLRLGLLDFISTGVHWREIQPCR